MTPLLLLGFTVSLILSPLPRAEGGSACGSYDYALCDDDTCVSNGLFCDTVPYGCLDGSDESRCVYPGGYCNPGTKLCADGITCVRASYFCDEYWVDGEDCPDHSDEGLPFCDVAVSCGSDERECDDGTCIPSSSWCNGQADCPDGSDEGTANCDDGVEQCLKCSGARSLDDCDPETCEPSQKYCKWQDVKKRDGSWVYNSGCVAVCRSGHIGERGNPDSGVGVHKGCCGYNGCDTFHTQQ